MAFEAVISRLVAAAQAGDVVTAGAGLVGGGAVLLGLLALWLFKPWRARRAPQQRQFLRFERLLARQGLRRATGEGPRDFAARAARRLPAQAVLIKDFLRCWEAQVYAGEQLDPVPLKLALRSLRRALPWRLTRPPEQS